MNKRFLLAALATLLLGTAACSSNPPANNIGLIDVPRITANWPKFLNYQNQLNADVATIQRSRASQGDKQRQLAALNAKFAAGQNELTDDVRNAAQQVANDKHLKYVFTHGFVGYGGTDITADVESILKITEKPTPSP